jgi:hypothetical protein
MADAPKKPKKAKKDKKPKKDKGKGKAKAKAGDDGAAAAAAPPAAKPKYPVFAPRIYTDAEWGAMTDGYRDIPRGQWAEIPRGSHIRMQKNDGKKLRGGRLMRVQGDRDDPTKRMFVVRGVAPDGRTFGRDIPLRFETLKKVWSKHEPVEILASEDASLEIAAMKRRLGALETRMERILGILEKITRSGGSAAGSAYSR